MTTGSDDPKTGWYLSRPLHQGSGHCSWRSVLSKIWAVILAELVILVTLILMILPAYFSGWQEVEETYQVLSAPESIALPVSERFDQGSLRFIHCVKGPAEESGALYSLRCKYKESSETANAARSYLGKKGFDLDSSRGNVNVVPAMGHGAQQFYLLLLAAFLWLTWSRLFVHSIKRDLKNALSFIRSKPYHLSLPALAAFSANFVVTYFLPPAEANGSPTTSDALGWVLVSVLVVAPILEEVVFRGIVQDILLKQMRWWLAAVLGSFGFAAMHVLPNELLPHGYSAYLLFGFGLCWLRKKSGSLSICVLAHVLYNGLVLTLLMSASDVPPH